MATPTVQSGHTESGVHVTPDPVTFGSLSQGYAYSMTVKIHNHTKSSVRIRASCVPLDPEYARNEVMVSFIPTQIAPGMTTSIFIKLNASVVGTTKYKLCIDYGLYEKFVLEKVLTAYVMPIDMYKNLSKQLMVNNKKILLENVTAISRLLDYTIDKNISESTVYTSSLLDDDDIDELNDLPVIPYCYFDLNSQKLVFDKELSHVSKMIVLCLYRCE